MLWNIPTASLSLHMEYPKLSKMQSVSNQINHKDILGAGLLISHRESQQLPGSTHQPVGEQPVFPGNLWLPGGWRSVPLRAWRRLKDQHSMQTRTWWQVNTEVIYTCCIFHVHQMMTPLAATTLNTNSKGYRKTAFLCGLNTLQLIYKWLCGLRI